MIQEDTDWGDHAVVENMLSMDIIPCMSINQLPQRDVLSMAWRVHEQHYICMQKEDLQHLSKMLSIITQTYLKQNYPNT
jgi:hypothetical protein